MRVAVVGGGIAGLAAAWELRGQAEVTVLEPGRLGGRILTETFDGRPVEAGADAFITRRPEALELCAELGIGDLIAPAAGRSLLWWRGKLRELPGGMILGVPRGLIPLVTSGILGPAGLIRAAGDLVLPRTTLPPDPSVRDLVARRFGRQVADRLVDPLIGGIHAAATDRLSAETTVPQILEVARRSRSLMLGLRRLPSGDAASGPIFATHPLGLGHVVERLLAELGGAGVAFESARVERVTRGGAGWVVEPAGIRADAVVLATPAPVAARLLDPGAPAELSGMRSNSVAIATMAMPAIAPPEGANGYLVPRSSGLLTTACSFASSKWPHWAAPGRTLLRVSTGRAGDRRFEDLPDDQLVDRLASEVSAALGTGVTPDTWRVHRWPDAFPEYEVGHLRRLARLREEMTRSHPQVVLCGSSYEGAGIPACIGSGRAAARLLVQSRMNAA